MVLRRLMIWTVLLASLLWAAPAAAGWLIEHAVSGARRKGVVMLESNRMKTLELRDDGTPTTALILDLDTETLTQVDFKAREYVTGTAEEWSSLWRAMVDGAREHFLEQARKALPHGQRKRTGQGATSERVCREPRVEFRRSGEEATVAGHTAIRYEVLSDGKPSGEIWMARSVPAWRELDRQKLERFTSTVDKGTGCAPATVGFGLPGAELSRKAASEGYPMRIVDRKGSAGTIEVVKVEKRTLAPAEFQPPAGFARKTVKELMGQ